MRYLLFISHGGFADGLTEALGMMVGQRDDIVKVAFRDGMGLPEFKEHVRAAIAPMTRDDEIIVMADLVSGSPLATTMDALSEQVDLDKVRAVAGMNLPMALTAVENEEEPLEDTIAAMMEVAKEQVTPFNLTVSDSEDDI
ncbi:MAG: PTS fructose transporter subunit IIA [Oscillibacter sp.]|nr:PTS fructose transporter subunit IIA [Oscillibacter sp.]